MKVINQNKFLLINVLCSIILGVGSYFVASYFFKNNTDDKNGMLMEQSHAGSYCKTKRVNNNNYKFTKPMMYLESECESESETLFPIKSEITSLIKYYKNKGILDNAAVYLNDMDHSEWIGVDVDKGFSPGSLMKVPLAITLMKLVEMKKISLDQTITANQNSFVPYHQTYEGKVIEPGKTYTVKELLKYVLAYSDNNATNMIHQIVDKNVYAKVFDDLKIEKPVDGAGTFVINPKVYSTFMRVLYNGTYIGRAHSDMVLQMMSESSFTKGMAASIDSLGVISHKFGESTLGKQHQLHESGVIYVNGTSFILTVMTEGKDIKQLPDVIKEISKLAYNIIESGSSRAVAKAE